jgi:hypothetical protein
MNIKNKKFCFLILETELSEIQKKAKDLGVNTSDFIRSRISKSHNKVKEQSIIRTISTIDEIKDMLFNLTTYIVSFPIFQTV